MPGTLFVVATPIGNLEDVSARAVSVLRKVALIAAEDTRRTAHLLARYGIQTSTTSVHEHNEGRKVAVILDRLAQGDDVALVSDAGTPGISDPGQQLIRAARLAGVKVVPIPGPSAPLTILMASGYGTLPLHFLGFPPARGKDRKDWFAQLPSLSGTVILFEAPHRIAKTLTSLQETLGDLPVFVGREMTKVHEEFVEGPISRVSAGLGQPRGEYTVAIEIGHPTDSGHSQAPDPAAIAVEFGQMSKLSLGNRRQILASLARKYGISNREVYRAIEKAKNSVDRPKTTG